MPSAPNYPSNKVNVGGDARAPLNPDGTQSASFDLSVDNAAGAALRSIEVTTVDVAINKGKDLFSGVIHATEKAVKRAAAKSPIPGKLESTIRATLAKQWSQGKGGLIEIAENGDRVRITKSVPPKRLPMDNIFDEFAREVKTVPHHDLLDAVNIVDAQDGRVLARIERSGTTWTRTR